MMYSRGKACSERPFIGRFFARNCNLVQKKLLGGKCRKKECWERDSKTTKAKFFLREKTKIGNVKGGNMTTLTEFTSWEA